MKSKVNTEKSKVMKVAKLKQQKIENQLGGSGHVSKCKWVCARGELQNR